MTEAIRIEKGGGEKIVPGRKLGKPGEEKGLKPKEVR